MTHFNEAAFDRLMLKVMSMGSTKVKIRCNSSFIDYMFEDIPKEERDFILKTCDGKIKNYKCFDLIYDESLEDIFYLDFPKRESMVFPIKDYLMDA